MIAMIFGPPGSGKGTQAAKVAVRLGLPHVATGDMLRDEVARGTVLGREAEPIMRAGDLLPDDLVVRMIGARLDQPDATAGVILDGFPRTVTQATALDAMLASRGANVDVLVSLEVPDAEISARVLRRSELEGRSDDTPAALANRMATYRDDTAPVLEHYVGTATRIERVDGVGSVDTVTERIATALRRTGPAVNA